MRPHIFPRHPRGGVNSTWLAFLASVLLLALLVGLFVRSRDSGSQTGTAAKEPLIVYCAAGLKKPVEAIAQQYEQEYGIPIQLQYGGSNTLLANLSIAKRGDLYLPADTSYLQTARKKNLVDEEIPVAVMHAVIAVGKSNPKNIASLDDALRDGVKLAQANPDAAAIGKLSREALQKSGRWKAVEERTVVYKSTVNDVATDIKIGTVDAGFVWDSTVKQYPDLRGISVPELAGAEAHIAIAVLRCTPRPTAALRFARYLSARDKGLPEFKKNGFETVEGDVWAEKPELHLLGGAMLRPAIEATLTAFQRREGVDIVTVYNGCGILVAQMKAGERPDAYFSCDTSFMVQVKDIFLDSREISQNQLVIVVPKGNPHGIRDLKDLLHPGLRVGVGHEKQCALGALTAKTLIETKLYANVMKNVVVQSPTGDFLVNQLRTGSLDAVVAYVSNTVSAAAAVETIPIDVPCALAVQPIAVGRDSKYKQLSQRLIEQIVSSESKARFLSQGFQWKADAK